MSCTFCNGTGEWNQASENYLKDHICQCIVYDRKFCPICGESCHHDTSQNPKQIIDPGFGGLSAVVSNTTLEDVVTRQEEEELITA